MAAKNKKSKTMIRKDIIDFLNASSGKIDPKSGKYSCGIIHKTCLVLATSAKDTPRATVLEFFNEGLTIYILSEGGEKFKNIGENKNVALGIGTSGRTPLTVRGVNIWGVAEVFTDETPEFAHAVELFSSIIGSMEKETGGPLEIPKGLLRAIRVTPTKMVYHHNSKGIKNARWTQK